MSQSNQNKIICTLCIILITNLIIVDPVSSHVIKSEQKQINEPQSQLLTFALSLNLTSTSTQRPKAMAKAKGEDLLTPTNLPRTPNLHEKFPQYTEEDLEFLEQVTDADLEIVKNEPRPPIPTNNATMSSDLAELALMALGLTLLIMFCGFVIKRNKCKIATYITRRSFTPQVSQSDWMELTPIDLGYQFLLTPDPSPVHHHTDADHVQPISTGTVGQGKDQGNSQEPEQEGIFNSLAQDSRNSINYMDEVEQQQQIPIFPVCPPKKQKQTPREESQKESSIDDSDHVED